MAKEDVRAFRQAVGDLAVAPGEHPVMPRETEGLVELEQGDLGARARPFVLQVGAGDEVQAAAPLGVEALGFREGFLDRQEGHLDAFLLLGGDEVEVVGHQIGDLGGLGGAETPAVLVVECHRAVAGRRHAANVGAQDLDVVPPGQPLDRVILEAVDPRRAQVGWHGKLMRGPNTAADAIARLEDGDVVPVDDEVPRGRQPRDAGTDHENLSRLRVHVHQHAASFRQTRSE